MDITWTKDQLKDSSGRSLTQSLFLELGYRTEFAIFTLNNEDKIYQGKVYPSLKQFYLDCEDPYEYKFAIKCLLGWEHWERLTRNKDIAPYVEQWRAELAIRLASAGVMSIMDAALKEDSPNFQAAKWLAERGWDKRGAGRPSKAEKQRSEEIEKRILGDLQDNVVRMEKYNG